MDPPAVDLYHERQHLQHCLLHTVNNLLQRRQYTAQSFNAISDQLQYARRTLFLGNYDVNLLEAVCQLHGWELRWHPAQDTDLQQLHLDDPQLVGLVVNIAGSGWLSWLTGGRHWLALKKLSGVWYNLDSKLCEPQPFGDRQDPAGEGYLKVFLQEALSQEAHLFLVRAEQDLPGSG